MDSQQDREHWTFSCISPSVRFDLAKNWPVILVLSEGVLVRNFVACALALNEYSVLRAADHQEALKLLANASQPVRVLLVCSPTDPDMTLLERCASDYPDLKAIFLSREMYSKLAGLAGPQVSVSQELPEILVQTLRRALSDRAFAHQIGSP